MCVYCVYIHMYVYISEKYVVYILNIFIYNTNYEYKYRHFLNIYCMYVYI